jgi:acyl-coenzyme A synthetase/AMP-(fatty) acid ligase
VSCTTGGRRPSVEVLDGIGSSEAYHIYISNRPGRVRPGSTGELVPGYDAHLAENGELSIEGDTAALMYWGEHEKTKQTFSGDTVRTGDLFERDDDGYFWYRGRADDLIKVGGIWVAPAEIEDCLLAHPEVVECAVIGVDREGLTLASAYVVTRSELEEAELRDFARERLAGHKVPKQISFVDELPKTPSGKIDRRSLRETQVAA